MKNGEKILEVSHLKKYFAAGKGTLKAVDDVSFYVNKERMSTASGEKKKRISPKRFRSFSKIPIPLWIQK